MSQQKPNQEDIPSHRITLLKNIKNSKVSALVRYSWLPPEESAKEWNIPLSSVFRFTAGPLLITIESGLVIGFSSLPEKASVTLWVEETEEGERNDEMSIINDCDLFPIDASDSIYSETLIKKLVGKSIISIKIIKRDAENVLLEQTPREAGLIIEFENGCELILSHGLHDNSDDFAIIFRDEILQDNIGKIQEYSMCNV